MPNNMAKMSITMEKIFVDLLSAGSVQDHHPDWHEKNEGQHFPAKTLIPLGLWLVRNHINLDIIIHVFLNQYQGAASEGAMASGTLLT